MLVCIGTLIDNKRTVGFRLCDTDAMLVKEVVYESLYNALNDGNVDVVNLRACNGKIVGYSGNLARYTAINLKTKAIIGVPSYVVLSKYERINSYKLMDSNGNVQIVNHKKLLDYNLANVEFDELGRAIPIEGQIASENLVGISVLYRVTYFIYICRDNFSGSIFVTNIANIERIRKSGGLDEVNLTTDLSDILGEKEKVVSTAFKNNTPLFGMACIEGLTDDAIKEISKCPIKKRDSQVLEWMLITGSSLAGIRFEAEGALLRVYINDELCTDEKGESLAGALKIDLCSGTIYAYKDGEWLISKFCSNDIKMHGIPMKKKKELLKTKIIK